MREWVAAERRGLGPRLPRRRAAARRDPRDLRHERRARPRASSPTACTPRNHARARHRRERPQRPEGDPPARRRRLGLRRRSGPTTSTTRCAPAHRRPRRLLRRVRRASTQLAKAFRRPVRPRRRLLDVPPPALRRAGRRPPAPSSSSSSTRTTTRSATAPSATGCPPRSGRSPRSARCCRRSCRCCSWARSTARRAPFQFFTDHIDEEIADATARGPPARVRGLRRVRRRGGARPAGPGDVRALEAHARGRRRRSRALYARLLARAPRAAAGADADAVDCDEAAPLAARAPRAVHARRELRRDAPQPSRSRAPTSSSSPPTTARAWTTAASTCPRAPERSCDDRAPIERARGLARPARSRSARPGTATARTSRCSPSTPTRVELCLFDDDGSEERIEVAERTAHNWHCYLPGVGPGQRYGYRVHGPYEPERRATASTRPSC